MEDNVLKNEDILKKTEWQRKTYPLKLNLTGVQKAKIDQMIDNYKVCINKVIDKILNEFFKKHMEQLCDENIKTDKCILCGKEKKLNYKLKGFDFVKYAEKKGKPIYKPLLDSDKEHKICKNCHFSHYSLRKFFLPSSKREVPIQSWDMTKFANLGKSNKVYDSCLQKAVECIKSQIEIKEKIKYKIK